MSREIWKVAVKPNAFTVSLPVGARVLSFGTQPGAMDHASQVGWGTDAHPRMWVLVDPEAPTELRKFACVGGWSLPDEVDSCTFVGTLQMQGGALVFHLFDAGVA